MPWHGDNSRKPTRVSADLNVIWLDDWAGGDERARRGLNVCYVPTAARDPENMARFEPALSAGTLQLFARTHAQFVARAVPHPGVPRASIVISEVQSANFEVCRNLPFQWSAWLPGVDEDPAEAAAQRLPLDAVIFEVRPRWLAGTDEHARRRRDWTASASAASTTSSRSRPSPDGRATLERSSSDKFAEECEAERQAMLSSGAVDQGELRDKVELLEEALLAADISIDAATPEQERLLIETAQDIDRRHSEGSDTAGTRERPLHAKATEEHVGHPQERERESETPTHHA